MIKSKKLLLSTLFLTSLLYSEDSLWETIKQDHINYYSTTNLINYSYAFAAGAVVANTDMDQNIQDAYQNDIRSQATDDFSEIAKTFGEGKYMIPLSLLASSVNLVYDDTYVGQWGSITARAYLVGAPSLLLMQKVTGASRPGEKEDASHWDFFEDTNGVSGHAFMGAVPFIAMASMSDNIYIKISAYTASIFTALSRLNDDDHYASQITLGWYMAYTSVHSLHGIKTKKDEISFAPLVSTNNTYGVLASKSW